jgi:hypothetical protein
VEGRRPRQASVTNHDRFSVVIRKRKQINERGNKKKKGRSHKGRKENRSTTIDVDGRTGAVGLVYR